MDASVDYDEVCDRHEPDLVIFESGVYSAQCEISNIQKHSSIPRLGFIHCDAYCRSRKRAIAHFDRWMVRHCVTTSVALAAHTPELAARLFVWPNFADDEIFRDYGTDRVLPVLLTGSQATHYPWRNQTGQTLSAHLTHARTPHFGWFGKAVQESRWMPQGEQYARLIASARIAPTCGTVALDVVRKHFEIPACKTVLFTERSAALDAAGFVDGVNCVFADPDNAADRARELLVDLEQCQRIADAGRRLVVERHTARSRQQIAEWFRLQAKANPRQRVVQVSPFLPMTVVDAPSYRFACEPHAGVERGLIRDGYRDLARNEAVNAKQKFLRASNYHSTAEATVGTAICHLFGGDAQAAVTLLWDEIHSTFCAVPGDADPVELSCLIIALLCSGDKVQALAKSRQYPDLHHPELDAARHAVHLIFGLDAIRSGAQLDTRRQSVHDLGDYGALPFLPRLRTLLIACSQGASVEKLVRGERLIQAVLQTEGGPTSAGPSAAFSSAKRQLLPWAAAWLAAVQRFGQRLVRAAPNRLVRSYQRLMRSSRSQPLTGTVEVASAVRDARAGRVLVIASSAASRFVEFAAGELRRSPDLIELQVVVGIQEGSAPTYLSGLDAVLQHVGPTPGAITQRAEQCLRSWQTAGNACDLLMLDCENVNLCPSVVTPILAKNVVLYGVNSETGQQACASCLRTEGYRLVEYDAQREPGYAIFESGVDAGRFGVVASENETSMSPRSAATEPTPLRV